MRYIPPARMANIYRTLLVYDLPVPVDISTALVEAGYELSSLTPRATWAKADVLSILRDHGLEPSEGGLEPTSDEPTEEQTVHNENLDTLEDIAGDLAVVLLEHNVAPAEVEATYKLIVEHEVPAPKRGRGRPKKVSN